MHLPLKHSIAQNTATAPDSAQPPCCLLPLGIALTCSCMSALARRCPPMHGKLLSRAPESAPALARSPAPAPAHARPRPLLRAPPRARARSRTRTPMPLPGALETSIRANPRHSARDDGQTLHSARWLLRAARQMSGSARSPSVDGSAWLGTARHGLTSLCRCPCRPARHA